MHTETEGESLVIVNYWLITVQEVITRMFYSGSILIIFIRLIVAQYLKFSVFKVLHFPLHFTVNFCQKIFAFWTKNIIQNWVL